VATAAPDAEARRSAPSVEETMAQILIVEDDANIAKLLQVRLEKVGYTIVWVADGAQALAAARDRMPDLVLLDIMLLGMEGFQVVKRLKVDPRTKHIPVIMLTARSEGQAVLTGLDSGADAYLVKPVHFPDLIKRIQVFLERNSRSS
jgi:two-component system phosphate regulon response regulator PhoB